jgi:hypothetical protein
MVGTNPGNGHPYSWSAIVNGCDAALMAASPYPRIAAYLARETTPALDGARVTHVWSADRAEAERVARTCLVPTVVAAPADMLGTVDAVIVPTDDPAVHWPLARTFLSAGVPVFVDKPLAADPGTLADFAAFAAKPGRLMSCSAVRFSPKLAALAGRVRESGTPVAIHAATRATWLRYGAHLLEAVVALAPAARPVAVRHVRHHDTSAVVVTFDTGLVATMVVAERGAPTIAVSAYTETAVVGEAIDDWFVMFRATLVAFLDMVRTGGAAVPFEETRTIVSLLIAGCRSEAAGGAEIEARETVR